MRQLVAASLIGILPFFGVARNQCGQRVPASFSYPQSQETIQIDAEIRSRSLSGVVIDPNGAVASQVLVERVRRAWGKRLSAVLSDSDGHFAFGGVGAGTHFLRVSKPGFNTILLKVRVTSKIRSGLQIEIEPSN